MRSLRRFLSTVTFACVLPGAVVAQGALFPKPGEANPAQASAATFYNIGKMNILQGAEKMPAEHYSYQPTKDVRTFAAVVAHIADAQFIFCSAARKEPNPNGENLQSGQVTQTIETSGKHSKTEIVAALKRSFEYCDPVFAGGNDASWSETVRLNAAERPKATPLLLALIHMWEHYGNMTTYLREKGIVPPSTERLQQRRRP